MELEGATSERMLLEAELRVRRRRVLRAEAAVAGVFALGLGAVFAAKETAPGAFEAAVAFFAVATFGSLLAVWRTARRHWRCPACDVRWDTRDTLASFHWNHCPSCGAGLCAYPVQRDRERAAHIAFALADLPHDELVARFERRRRRGLWLAGAAALVGLAVLACIQGLELGEMAEQGVVAAFAAAVAGSLVWAMRCPRCQTGVIAAGRHCQRCGLHLGDGAGGETGNRDRL